MKRNIKKSHNGNVKNLKCKSKSQLQSATKQYISPLFNKIAFTEKHFTKDQLTILPVELK